MRDTPALSNAESVDHDKDADSTFLQNAGVKKKRDIHTAPYRAQIKQIIAELLSNVLTPSPSLFSLTTWRDYCRSTPLH